MGRSGMTKGVCSTVTRPSLAVVVFMFSCVLVERQEDIKPGVTSGSFCPLDRTAWRECCGEGRGGERARERLVRLLFYGETYGRSLSKRQINIPQKRTEALFPQLGPAETASAATPPVSSLFRSSRVLVQGRRPRCRRPQYWYFQPSIHPATSSIQSAEPLGVEMPVIRRYDAKELGCVDTADPTLASATVPRPRNLVSKYACVFSAHPVTSLRRNGSSRPHCPIIDTTLTIEYLDMLLALFGHAASSTSKP